MNVVIDGVKYVPQPPKPKGKKLAAALEVRFDSDAGDDLTVRQYLRELLSTLWEKGESFDGKRPFGNSGWEYDIYIALAKAKFIKLGKPQPDYGEPYDWTQKQIDMAHAYVHDLILAVFFGSDE